MLATVRSVTKRTTRNRRTMVTANVGDGSGRMEVVFFNQPWRERQLREGLQIALFGKADVYRGGLQMTNPVVDLIGDRTGRIVPIYPQSEKAQINTWEIAGWVEEALRRCRERGIADPLPDDGPAPSRARRRASTRSRNIHLPEIDRGEGAGPSAARVRRAAAGADSCWCCASGRWSANSAGSSTTSTASSCGRFYDALPYALTGAQQRAIGEIEADLAAPHPMHRLLQGDVGSGKTVVAVAHDARRGAGRAPGGADGADRGAGRAARHRACGRCSTASACPTPAISSAIDRCGSSC